MCFVDRDQRQRRRPIDQCAKAGARCALRRGIEQIKIAVAKAADRLIPIVVG